MIRLDLVTGFLGAGKTTFLKRLIPQLAAAGEKIALLISDYGAVNIDRLFLEEELEGLCDVEMVVAGDFDSHRRRYKTKLIALAMQGYDRVMVEPSGVYDVEEFFDVLHEEPLDQWYVAGTVMAVVDAGLPEELTEESEYLLMAQAAEAGAVVLSKTQTADAAQRTRVADHLNRALARFGCGRHFALPEGDDLPADPRDTLWVKPWEALTKEDLTAIASAGWRAEDHEHRGYFRTNAYHTVYRLEAGLSVEEVCEAARQLFADEAIGHVLRVKGFVPVPEDAAHPWRQINITRKEEEIRPAKAGQDILIVIGEGLDHPAVEERLTRRNACSTAHWDRQA